MSSKNNKSRKIEWSWENSAILLPLAYEHRELNSIYTACIIAEQCGCKVITFHVKTEANNEESKKEFLDRLDSYAKFFRIEYEVKETSEVYDSDDLSKISDLIVKSSEENNCRSIIMGAHRESFLRELIGRISDRVARKANCNVILVESSNTGMTMPRLPKRIMVTILDNLAHQDAFILAAAFTSTASAPDCEIIAGRVIRIPAATPLPAIESSKLFKVIEKAFAEQMALAIESLGRLFTPRILPVRDIGQGVTDFTTQEGIELLILESEQPGRLGPAMTREEYAIVKKTPCIVLVVIPNR